MQTNAVSELAMALNDSDGAVALAAAKSLERIGVEAGSPALSDQLDSSSDSLRLACVNALGKTGGEIGAQGLVRALTDKSAQIRTAAMQALTTMDPACIPTVLNALRHEKKVIRAGAIEVLKQRHAIPLSGPALIEYKLAVISTDAQETLNTGLIQELVATKEDGISTLLEAAAHPVKDIREHAFRALEFIGEPVAEKALAAVRTKSSSAARSWYESRTQWHGAPSWRIDLWAALSVLNPDFEREYMKLKGDDALRIISGDDFSVPRADIPLLINLLGDSTHRETAKKKLIQSGALSVLPILAATQAQDEAIASAAAEIIGELADPRGTRPLMNVLRPKIEAGEALSASPFYLALLKLNAPEAEPVLLLQIRPHVDRAIQLFERQYPDARVMSAETLDADADRDRPVTFRLGYIASHKAGAAIVTFIKNEDGHWVPDPVLPATLPQ